MYVAIGDRLVSCRGETQRKPGSETGVHNA